MELNYIYNLVGKIEYVVVPYDIWNKVSDYAKKIDIPILKEEEQKFNPAEFRGMLSHYNFNTEQELKKIKDQWNQNI